MSEPRGGPARGGPRQEALGRRAASRGGSAGRGHGRRDALAGARGAAAGPADRRAHARRALRLPRRGGAPARHHEHVRLRARARGARHPHPRGRRPRLLEPAAGERPAPLARGARQPARRAGARTRCSPRRWPGSRSTRSRCSPCTPARPAGTRCGRCARRSRTPSDGARGGAARRRTWPGAHLPRALRRRARRGAARGARDADRPRGHAHRLRPPPARAARRASGAWRTCAS